MAMTQRVGNLNATQRVSLERAFKRAERKRKFYHLCLNAIENHISKEKPITYASIAREVGCHTMTVFDHIGSNKLVKKILADYARLHSRKNNLYQQNAVIRRLKKRYPFSDPRHEAVQSLTPA